MSRNCRSACIIFSLVLLLGVVQTSQAGNHRGRKHCPCPDVCQPSAQPAIVAEVKSDPPTPEENALAILRRWNEESDKRSTVYAEFTRNIEDADFGETQISDGSYRVSGPDKMRLDIFKGDRAESFVMHPANIGSEVWHYSPPLKQLQIYSFPPQKSVSKSSDEEIEAGFARNALPSALYCPDWQAIQKTHTIKIVTEKAEVVVLRFEPKTIEKASWFARRFWLFSDCGATVELSTKEWRPLNLQFDEGKNKVSFRLNKFYANIPIADTDFETKIPSKFEVTRIQIPSTELSPQEPSPQQASVKTN